MLDILEEAHPEARCALVYRNAFELAVATILSAQCTDERVNKVTPGLFGRYPDAGALARAPLADVEEVIRSTGFFRAKARSITGFAKGLVERHGGEVPRSMAALVPLPGIGRKTANVVLGHAFDVAEGIAVDTHVLRVTNRLGLAVGEDPLDVEKQLDGPRPPRAVDADDRPPHLPRPQGLRRPPAGLWRVPALRRVRLAEPAGLGLGRAAA